MWQKKINVLFLLYGLLSTWLGIVHFTFALYTGEIKRFVKV